MKIYTVQYIEFPITGPAKGVDNSVFESNSSPEIIADSFARRYNALRKEVGAKEFNYLDAKVDVAGKKHFSIDMLIKALKAPDADGVVGQFEYVDEKNNRVIKCLIRADKWEYTSLARPYYGAQQQGRQEVYDFLVGFKSVCNDFDAALASAQVNFHLKDMDED